MHPTTTRKVQRSRPVSQQVSDFGHICHAHSCHEKVQTGSRKLVQPNCILHILFIGPVPTVHSLLRLRQNERSVIQRNICLVRPCSHGFRPTASACKPFGVSMLFPIGICAIDHTVNYGRIWNPWCNKTCPVISLLYCEIPSVSTSGILDTE